MGIFAKFISAVTIDSLSKSNTLKDLGSATMNLVKSSDNKSLSQRAAEGVLQFPVIVSSALDIETAQTITKALERQFATFAQVAFSMSPTLTYDKNVSAADYLKRFHQNQKGLMMDLVLKEGYECIETDKYVVLSGVYETTTNKLNAINKEQLINLVECLRNDILNNKYTPKLEFLYNFSDKELNKKHNNPLYEADNNIGNEKLKLEKDKFKYQKERDNIKDKVDAEKFAQQYHQKFDTIDYFRDILHDNDVKKANELIATTLHLRIKLINKNQEQVGTVDFIVGIKGIMHPVKSNEMIMNMVSACRNNDKIFNFLRWTTGEISFFKDFFFNINEVKKDVIDRSKGASPWWTALKRRKEYKGIAQMLNKFKPGQGNSVLPNATIVISSEEVEFIKTEFGYDLYDNYFISKIMGQYFLLGFAIIDNSSQVAHFIFDGDPDFQSVTFSALERSGSNDERKFKEMLKTLNRM